MDPLTQSKTGTRWSQTSRAIYNDNAPIQWAAAKQAAPGERVSGDEFLVQRFPGGVLVAAVDGLGHGEEATLAARLAVSTLAAHAHESVLSLVERCHAALNKTRGVVMTLGSFCEAEGSITWMGVGNVEGLLIRADPTQQPSRESVLMRGGVVGYQLPPLSASLVRVQTGDLLILTTDGIDPSYASKLPVQDSPHRLAGMIMDKYSKGTDDALVLVLRYVGTRR